ncbi:LPD29 domain-containing protein [Serratia sp. JSRIV006]|uniref:LPD29 domain-containing protein n=1 Tax=Serratia sp. JSRIV006 TaxID=2831896 RepID=UPI001CC06154|nr:LPD29 domain-containing protein [Serratia sp. JSRIV006]UAN65804.1 hypothetical protein KGP16_27125 [Serratia sp. JSRIV006]
MSANMKNIDKTLIVVGQVVSTNLYGRGRGVIYGIHGEQKPESVLLFGNGVGVRGGNAEFDIAFESGSLSKKLPEGILRGIQWKIYDEVVDEKEVVIIYSKALAAEKAKKEEEEVQEIAFNLAVEKIKTAPEYKDLAQGINGAKQVGCNMRKELKAMFPGFKFSVRKGHGDSIYIKWTDGPQEEKVKSIVDKYKAGRFNGMIDLYENNETPFNKVYGGVQYVFTDREYSDALTEKAISIFNEKFSNQFNTEITLEKYKKGELWRIGQDSFCGRNGVDGEINKIRRNLSSI